MVYRGPGIERQSVGPVDVGLGEEREVRDESAAGADILQRVHDLRWGARLLLHTIEDDVRNSYPRRKRIVF